MKNKILEANIGMIVNKTLSGLNINALKYLLPLWLAPVVGVTLRICVGAVAFWLISIFDIPRNNTLRDKFMLFLLGLTFFYGYMYLYLVGLSYTTPVSCAIFNSMQPIWVFILSVLFLHEKVRLTKVLGIVLGFGAALLCILTQPADELARNPLLGNLMVMGCSFCYAIFLVLGSRLMRRVDTLTMLRYLFLGGACTALVVNGICGFDAPLFAGPLQWKPFAVLLFVLLFPTVVGYLFIPMGLKYLSPTTVAVYGYLILAVAAVVSFALGMDRFSWFQALSILLICLSIYWVEIAERGGVKK